MMQQPTCKGLQVRKVSDALIIFHAVRHKMLPMVRRRLDADERRNIMPGDVFVWEERGPNAEASGLGIERWTDSIRWGPSRTKDDFLYYHEKQSTDGDVITDSSDTPFGRPLIKQTYSVYLEFYPGRQLKWHLIAYFTQNTRDQLRTIDDIPELAEMNVPHGAYKSARNPKRPAREINSLGGSPLYHPYQFETRDTASHEDPISAMQGGGDHREVKLAPLRYLQSIPPQRRHVVDEMAIIRLPITYHQF